MESFESFLDEEWESLSKIFSSDQDASIIINNHGLFSSEQDHDLNIEIPSNISPLMTESNIVDPSFINNHGFCYAYENINPNYHHNFSQQNSNNGCVASYDAASFPNTSPNNISLSTNAIDFYDDINNTSMLLAQVISDDSLEELLCLRQNINIENSVDPSMPIMDKLNYTPAKRKIETPESPNIVEDKVNEEKSDLKKKTRVLRDNKIKKKVQPKKKQKVMNATVNVKQIDGDDTNNKKVDTNAPITSSSSCSSEDDVNGGTINSNWKTRAGRGAATDPQSLYARKRRERINERLKVLQNLVPNGTKVDISTMLEEAVEYVKFLKLQIKLLSSDDMWMYAPIAYNGMDMGLYQKLSQS